MQEKDIAKEEYNFLFCVRTQPIIFNQEMCQQI